MVKGSSLRVSVANLSEGGLDLKLSLAEDWFGQWQKEDSRLEFGGPGAITARIHLAKHGRDILLRGRLEGALPLTCSRCLETFAFAMAADFDLLLAPGPQSLGGGQEELSADDLDLDFYGGDEVNLEDFLREQILLGLPLKPLCTETCRGLCTQCGVDLNRQTCTCQEHKGESAFAALATMKE